MIHPMLRALGDYIRPVDNRNTAMALGANDVMGINIDKRFMPSVANLSTTDLTKYKIVRKGQFVYSAMQVGRDECVRVALYQNERPIIVSPAYDVFEVKAENSLMSEFIFQWFSRPEFDRYGWFLSDGSVRSSLEFPRFCDIQIPIPPIEKQRGIVAAWKAAQTLRDSLQNTLVRLHRAAQAYLEAAAKSASLCALGDYVRPVDNRNTSMTLGADDVKGVSIEKKIIETKANLLGVDLSAYKIVRKNQFVYSNVTSRNGGKITLALYQDEKPILVSPVNPAFEIANTGKLLPEFLFLWFTRPEFDRYARYHSIGSAREVFDWSEMRAVELPIPPIEEQCAIVALFRAAETRRRIAEKLNAIMPKLGTILMKGLQE